MSTSLKELRSLIKEAMKEYVDISGGAGHEIHAFSVPNKAPTVGHSTDVPPDPVEIANAFVVAVKQLVHPVSNKEGNAALKAEVQRCRRGLEDWVEHEDALNAAAEIAAETLISSLDMTGIRHSKSSGTLSY